MKVNLFLVLVFGILAISLCAAAPPPTTPSYIEKINSVLQVGSGLTTTDNIFTLALDGIDPKTHSALVSVYSYNGDLIAVEDIAEGKSLSRTLSGADITITVHKTAQPSWETGPVPWANITLAVLSSTKTVDDLGVYDYSIVPVIVMFKDVEVTTGDALLAIDSMCGDWGYEKVKEGGSITRNICGNAYKITVMQVSPVSLSLWNRNRAKLKIERVNSGTDFDTNIYNLTWVNYSPLEYDMGGGAITKIRLDDLETETRSAIISLLDSSDNIIAQEKIKEGQTLVRTGAGGYKFQIKTIKIGAGSGMPAQGNNQGAWAKFQIVPGTTAAESPVCVLPDCQLAQLDGGVSRGSLTVVLANFEKDTRKALVILYDGMDNIGNETIAEGQTIVRNTSTGKYSIKLVSAATGYSYSYTGNENATWAKFELKPSTAAITSTANYTTVFFPGVLYSDDFNLAILLYGMEPVSHDATLYVYDTSGPPMLISIDKVKAGGSVVRRVGSQNYLIKVQSTAPPYYSGPSSWAKMSIQTTTAAQTVNYTATGPAGMPQITCANGEMNVSLDGLETVTRKPLISLRNASSGDILRYDKVAVGATTLYRIEDYGNCSVKVVQTADDPFFPPGIWAKMVVN
ncbi:MAG: hypothetical protein V1492_01350 [Candidatus Micrarchaeota archaeon]